MTRSFYVFFDLRLNERLSKHSWGWWFETPSRSLWRHFMKTGNGCHSQHFTCIDTRCIFSGEWVLQTKSLQRIFVAEPLPKSMTTGDKNAHQRENYQGCFIQIKYWFFIVVKLFYAYLNCTNLWSQESSPVKMRQNLLRYLLSNRQHIIISTTDRPDCCHLYDL